MSTKDLAYIKDVFNWNIIALKKYQEYQNYIQDTQIIKLLDKLIKEHQNNCDKLIMLLEENHE